MNSITKSFPINVLGAAPIHEMQALDAVILMHPIHYGFYDASELLYIFFSSPGYRKQHKPLLHYIKAGSYHNNISPSHYTLFLARNIASEM